jgi:hypothetical protein
MKGVEYILYHLLPILMLLAVSPDSEKKLENLSSFLTAAKDSVQTISASLETFQANVVPLMMNLANNKSETVNQSQKSGDNADQPRE